LRCGDLWRSNEQVAGRTGLTSYVEFLAIVGSLSLMRIQKKKDPLRGSFCSSSAR
jgi:hypothetical protein